MTGWLILLIILNPGVYHKWLEKFIVFNSFCFNKLFFTVNIEAIKIKKILNL